MQTIKYTQIRDQREQKITDLLNECKVFFAFSAEQFEKNKTPLQEGEKYVSIGAGGYLPKSKAEDYLNGLKSISQWGKDIIKESKNEEAHILYELINYECFYVYDIEDAYEVLKDDYTMEQVWTVFNKYKDQYTD